MVKSSRKHVYGAESHLNTASRTMIVLVQLKRNVKSKAVEDGVAVFERQERLHLNSDPGAIHLGEAFLVLRNLFVGEYVLSNQNVEEDCDRSKIRAIAVINATGGHRHTKSNEPNIPEGK